jgi:hypothetical protein
MRMRRTQIGNIEMLFLGQCRIGRQLSIVKGEEEFVAFARDAIDHPKPRCFLAGAFLIPVDDL